MTSCCRSQSGSVVSSSGLEIDSPALLTTRSTPPKASAAAPNAAATASSSVTSAVHGRRRRRAAADLARDGLGGLVGVEVGDDHAGALGGEPLGDGPADARAARRSPARPGWPAASACGIRASLASSSAQYSMRNFSLSSIGA